MKKFKCYLSILLILSRMICSTSSFAVNALPVADDDDTVIEVEEDLGGEEELQPMAATSCPTNYSLYYLDGRIYANVHFDHSHGGMQPHVHVYTWHQGPNGHWNSSSTCVAYDSGLYPRP